MLRGSLVLAKGRLAGTSYDETLNMTTIRGGGWRASLQRMTSTVSTGGVENSWMLRLDGPHGDCKFIPVSDYASVSNVDDPANWFSLWF